MSDGIGSEVNKISGEDFVTLSGKVYKMDLTILTEDIDNIMTVKHLKSVDRSLF